MSVLSHVMRLSLLIILVAVPFLNNKAVLNAYKMAVPLLFFYWSASDQTCAESIVQNRLMGNDADKSKLAEIINPYVNMDNREQALIVHAGVLVLYGIALFKTF